MKQKQHSLKPENEIDYIPLDVDDYLTIEDIQKEFTKSGKEVSNVQADKMKETIEKLVEASFILFQQLQAKKQEAKIINIKEQNEESHIIHTSKYRRAS